jgi:hypothetical protein
MTDKILVALRGASYGTIAMLVILAVFVARQQALTDSVIITIWIALICVGIGTEMYKDAFK